VSVGQVVDLAGALEVERDNWIAALASAGRSSAPLVVMHEASLSPRSTFGSATIFLCTDNQVDNQGDHQSDNQMGRSLVAMLPPEIACERVPRATAADRALWRSVREHPSLWEQPRPRKGTSVGTQQALRAARGHTVLCGTPGCDGLVDLQAARRLARAAGRDVIAAGDGCAGRSCSEHHASSRYALRQAQKARALLSGKRTLVLTPPTAAARVELRAVPPTLAEAIARSALSRATDTPSPALATDEPPPSPAAISTIASASAARAVLALTAATPSPSPALAARSIAPAAAPPPSAADVRVGGTYYVTAAPYGLEWLNGLPCVVRAARAGRFDVDVIYTRCGEVESVSLAPSHLRSRLARGEYLAALRLA